MGIVSKYFSILTKNPGTAFAVINHSQGPRSIGFSYKEFKARQRKVRFIFFVVMIGLLIAAVIIV